MLMGGTPRKLEMYSEAKLTVEQVLKDEPRLTKALFRRAQALLGLKMWLVSMPFSRS